jgi:dihydrofolate synthase/folylpolyglutamate synthase
MKSIKEYFDYLYKLERTGIKYDLKNITAILRSLGNPQNRFKSIHIAGTNGKGATASFIASILMEHGLKVGLFTSPHILKFNERIRINGKSIGNKYIKDFLNKNIGIIKRVKPSFFEVNTALAFEYFADHKIDVSVVECGLGGRLDSTNILKPDVSVITQIGMDHMQFLGNTLRSIAKEKIGIVKPDTPVIVSDNSTSLKKLFARSIAKKDFYYLDDTAIISNYEADTKSLRFHLKMTYSEISGIHAPLLGKFQARNASAGIMAAVTYLQQNCLVPVIPNIKKGISRVKVNSGYKGRLEIIRRNGTEFIFDISHNTEGIKSALEALGKKNIDLVIFGIMEDKDYKGALEELLKHSNNIIFTRPQYSRALDPSVLMNHSIRINKNEFLTLFLAENMKEAAKIAGSLSNKPKRILIIGSFFLVSDAIKAFKFQKYFS